MFKYFVLIKDTGIRRYGVPPSDWVISTLKTRKIGDFWAFDLPVDNGRGGDGYAEVYEREDAARLSGETWTKLPVPFEELSALSKALAGRDKAFLYYARALTKSRAAHIVIKDHLFRTGDCEFLGVIAPDLPGKTADGAQSKSAT